MEHFWIDPISVTNRSTHIHQSQHNRGLKGQTDLGNIVGGEHSQNFVGANKLITIRGGRVPEVFFTVAHFQSLPLWFCLLCRWRREATRFLMKPRITQAASPKSKPKGNKSSRAGFSAIYRSSSPLTSAQEDTESDVKSQENPGQASGDQPRLVQQSDDPSQENPGQASGDRLHFTCSTRHPEVTEPDLWDLHRLLLYAKKRKQQKTSTSFGRNEFPQSQCSMLRETDCSQKKMMT